MDPKRRINSRALLFGAGLIVLFMGLLVRVWWIQTVEASSILDKAKDQWERNKNIHAQRGSILDRNGGILAYEGRAYTVNGVLHPRNEDEAKRIGDDYVKDPFETARKLAPILGVPMENLTKVLTRPNSLYVTFGREGNKITEDQKNQIENLQYPVGTDGKKSKVNQMPGIFLTDTTRRYYPNNAFLSHVLGYVNYEDKGEMGIEKQFDKQLAGEPGQLSLIKDGAGYILPNGEQQYKPAKDGSDVVLTIDQNIQGYVEQAIDITAKEYQPQQMTVVVADPNTGEILGLANRPQYNPNKYWDIKDYKEQRNVAITSMYEPGSTFKIVTLAAAIEKGLFNETETYPSGQYTKLKGKPIKDHNGRGWGTISFLQGVQHSSNVAFVILGYERLKKDLLNTYFNLFGFGKKTGIDLPGETEGNMESFLHPRSQRDIAVTTFGQGIAVTAIQQVAAIGAIANGGELLKPLIVKELRDPHTGAVVKSYPKQVVGRVVTEATAKRTRDILETVVTSKEGTGGAYNIPGYHVAGKTGTAQKYNETTGKILEGHYIVSFIGFAPKDKPRLLVYVMVDDPVTDQGYGTWGRLMVAPIFNSVMERSLQYLQQSPDLTQPKEVSEKPQELTMPDFKGMATSAAVARAKQQGLDVESVGTGTKIVSQYPSALEKVYPGNKVVLITDRVKDVRMPDFKGKSLRDVMEFASIVNLNVNVTGNGYVDTQSIPPGTVIPPKGNLQVTLVQPAP
ncbi:penicillin-binding transpeptidase domain-containing protein [Brevibacillus ginsengisoli]|uniref:penicillin-binding transpeptidase domain-containing protein n=1 Tax=Brevibacillus ginsengisoli TaxID=363854 RepID=UPI003CF9F26F